MKNKSLAMNSVYNVAYKLLNVIFPLASATYTARILLANGVGKVSYSQNVVQYFVIIAALGIPNYGIREIARVKDRNEDTNRVFSELLLINAVSTTICMAGYYLMIFSLPYFYTELPLYGVVGITIFLNYFNVDWYYQGREEYGYIAFRSFIVKFLSLLALFAFVRRKEDYVIYAFIYTMAIAGNYLWNIVCLKRYGIRLVFRGIHFKQHIKPIVILLCTTIYIELYTMLDTTMLGAICGNDVVGYYTNSMKLVKILITVVTAIGGVLLPRLSYYYSMGKVSECGKIVSRIFSIMLYIFLPCGIGIILTADSIVPLLFGQSFVPAILTLKIAALLIFALGFSNLFGTQVLITFNGERQLMLCTIIGAVSNIAMNVFLIPIYQQNGAAVASDISEALVTILSIIFASKYIKIEVSKKFLFSTGISTAIMALVVLICKHIFTNVYIGLFGEILLGATAYFVTSVLFKNDVMHDVLTLVKKGNLSRGGH